MPTIRNREALTDHGNETARADALAMAAAGIERVHPRTAVPAVVERDGEQLRVDGRTIDLGTVGTLSVVGAGKGSSAVAAELEAILGDAIDGGVIAEKAGGERPLDRVATLGAGHPIPDETSREAGRRVLDAADAAGEGDLLIAPVTGGASALLAAPAGDLSLADLRTTTDALLRAGLRIDEINTVRTHLSRLKGGHLARRAAPATIVTLVVVDEVAGEPWGPTVPDPTTFADALAVLRRHDLAGELPAAVIEHLERGAGAPGLETPTAADLASVDARAIVLAGPADAPEAAAVEAAARGYEPLILSTTVEGESREVATAFAGIAREARTHGRPAEPPCVLISGGETTVSVVADPGEGGPNQEFALRSAIDVADEPGVTVLALGTDGTDGPTDVAGGLVDASTVGRLAERGIDPHERLARNDAAPALRAVDDAVVTGPTDTNVMDLRLTVVDP
jgi:hydroxypyruvate reductase